MEGFTSTVPRCTGDFLDAEILQSSTQGLVTEITILMANYHVILY